LGFARHNGVHRYPGTLPQGYPVTDELTVGIVPSQIELTANAEREPLGVAFFSRFPRGFQPLLPDPNLGREHSIARAEAHAIAGWQFWQELSGTL